MPEEVKSVELVCADFENDYRLEKALRDFLGLADAKLSRVPQGGVLITMLPSQEVEE